MENPVGEDRTQKAGLWAAVAAVTGAQAFVTMAMLALATVAPSAAPDFGLPPKAVGWQVGLIYAAAAASSAAAGGIAQRFGAGSTSLAALALAALGMIGLATASPAVAAAASVLIGASYGLTNPSASLVLQRVAPPERRSVVFSIKQTGVPLGGVAAGLLLPPLAALFGWRAAVAACALLALPVARSILAQRAGWDAERRPARIGVADAASGLRETLAEPRLRGIAGMAFGYAAMQLCLMSFAVAMLVEEHGWSLVAAGAALSLLQATGAGARIFWGWVADRAGRGAIVLAALGAGSTLSAFGTAALGSEASDAATLGLLILFAATAIGWNGVFLAEIARVAGPRSVGRATGAVMTVTFLGVMIGPALFTGLHALLGGYGPAFAAMAAATALGAASITRTLRAEPLDDALSRDAPLR